MKSNEKVLKKLKLETHPQQKTAKGDQKQVNPTFLALSIVPAGLRQLFRNRHDTSTGQCGAVFKSFQLCNSPGADRQCIKGLYWLPRYGTMQQYLKQSTALWQVLGESRENAVESGMGSESDVNGKVNMVCNMSRHRCWQLYCRNIVSTQLCLNPANTTAYPMENLGSEL